MSPIKICLPIVILTLLISLCFALPLSAEEVNAASPAISSAQTSQPTGDVQTPAQPVDDTSKPEKEKRRLTILPAFNVYYPADSKTQSRFGDSWPSVGIALAYKSNRMDPRKIELRLDGIAESSNSTSAYIFPIGLGINTRLSSTKNMTTYAGVTGNLYISKIESVPDNIDTGWKLKAGAGALVGANIGQKINVQASYYLIPDMGGFKMSGFNVSAHIQLWQF